MQWYKCTWYQVPYGVYPLVGTNLRDNKLAIAQRAPVVVFLPPARPQLPLKADPALVLFAA